MFISGFFLLIFLDCGWLWVVETAESETADNGVLNQADYNISFLKHLFQGFPQSFINRFHFLCWHFTSLAKMILFPWSMSNYNWWRFVPCFVSRSISVNTFISHWYCLFQKLKTSFTLHICILNSLIIGIKYYGFTFWDSNAILSIDEVRIVDQYLNTFNNHFYLLFFLTQAAIDVKCKYICKICVYLLIDYCLPKHTLKNHVVHWNFNDLLYVALYI